MNIDYSAVATLLSSLSGVVAAAGATAAAARAANRARNELGRVSRQTAAKAVGESDPAALANYLYDEIGSVAVRDVVRSAKLRTQAEDALATIVTFLSPDAATSRPEDVSEAPVVKMPEPRSEIANSIASAERGEIWTALARMRLATELTLQSLLAQRGIETSKRGAGQLVSLAAVNDVVTPEQAMALRDSLTTMNRGVHGEPIEPDDALRALDVSQAVLANLLAESG